MDLPSLPSWRTCALIGVGFFALTLAVYGHSIGYDFVRWDDGMLVYENPAIREISPSSLKRIFTTYDPELYIPLTFLSYQIDYQIGGQAATVYHTTNIIFHTLNAILVMWFTYLLIKKKWIALLCGFLFAIHPLHTEAVEWVSARKDLLSTFFFLWSIIGYLYWRDRGWNKFLFASLAAFTLGLLSKVMIITLPVILLLLDYLEGRQLWKWEVLKEKIPYFGLSVLFGLIGIFGKTGVIQSSTLSAKILMACKSAVFYLQQIVWPTSFSLLYPYTKTIVITSPDFFIPILVIIALSIFAWYSRRWGRTVVFGFLFYIITVAPTFLNFAKGGEMDVYFASDRYAYIPSIGIFLVIAWLLYHMTDLFSYSSDHEESEIKNQKSTIVFGIMTTIIVCICVLLSYKQSLVWANTETLFENVLAQYPDSSHVAHNNLGNVYRLRGDFQKAVSEYEQAIAIRPHAKTLSNLGVVYRRLAQYDQAFKTYEEALKIDPVSKEAHYGLGLVYMAQKRNAEAQKEFETALRIDPKYEEAYTNLGASFVAQGKIAEGIDAYEKAIEINPYFPDAHYNLAVALTESKETTRAIEEYEAVVRMVPTFIPARINLGLLYFQVGRREESKTQFREILNIDPANAAAKSALQQMGN